MDKQQQEEGFTVVSPDESFFFYDSLVRRVWIDKEKRPVVRVTGSHKHSCMFGSISIEGKHLFRQYPIFNGDTFLEFLKTIHDKFPKCHLFMYKASPHFPRPLFPFFYQYFIIFDLSLDCLLKPTLVTAFLN